MGLAADGVPSSRKLTFQHAALAEIAPDKQATPEVHESLRDRGLLPG
jgi:hypothetical protein